MEISDKLIDKLVDKFVDLLTDKIAEKVAKKIYKDSISIPPINPINPPYSSMKEPLDIITVMYGVVSTPYTAVDGISTNKAVTSFTNQTEIKN